MNILMINNTCGSGWNYKTELQKRGHNVILIANVNKVLDGTPDYRMDKNGLKQLSKAYPEFYFDIVHINAPNVFLIWKLTKWLKYTKMVLHWRGRDIREKSYPRYVYGWHGSDARKFCTTVPKTTFSLLYYKLMKSIPSYHLYSTIDLRWYINHLFNDDKPKQLLRTPVNTSVFKPIVNYEDRPYRLLIWGKGSLSSGEFIPHNKVPNLLNKYKEVTCYPNDGIDPHIVSVSAMEAAACGCKVTHHPYMNRDWVVKNASIQSQTNRLEKIYKELLNNV